MERKEGKKKKGRKRREEKEGKKKKKEKNGSKDLPLHCAEAWAV
jgi:hypothetical protein